MLKRESGQLCNAMKIIIVINDAFSAWIFRRGLIKSLVATTGNQVLVLAPKSEKYSQLIKSIGAKHIPIPIKRFIHPISDLVLCLRIYKIFKKEKPDVIHSFTIKPNIYAALIGKFLGVQSIFCSVTGLGAVYARDAHASLKVMRILITPLYYLACKYCTRFSFQNADDMEYFISKKILSERKAVLIRSSGVNLDEYSMEAADTQSAKKEMVLSGNEKIILMVARAIWSKGVREFIESSREVNRLNTPARYILIGSVESGPDAVPLNYLQSNASHNFQWLGFKDQIRDYIAASDIVVLPSFYPEGVPRCLLEAMALGKPIITTDNVGCKEVIEHEKNGYMIPVKNSQALADAVEKLLSNPSIMQEYGRYSRVKIEREFSEGLVIAETLSKLYKFDSVSDSETSCMDSSSLDLSRSDELSG